MPADNKTQSAERQEIDPVFKVVVTHNFGQLNILVQTQVEVSRLPRTMDALVILKSPGDVEKVRAETAFDYFRIHNHLELKGKNDSLDSCGVSPHPGTRPSLSGGSGCVGEGNDSHHHLRSQTHPCVAPQP